MYLDEKKIGEALVTLDETWRQVLLDAADLLDKEGWCQRSTFNFRGERCVLGVIYDVTMRDGVIHSNYAPPRCEAEARLVQWVGGGSLPRWNDAPGRTKEQATALLRLVARVR